MEDSRHGLGGKISFPLAEVFFLMARVLRAEKTRQVIGRGFEDQK